MVAPRVTLPDLDGLNPNELKALIVSQHELIVSRDSEIEQLKLLIAKLRRVRRSKSSTVSSDSQPASGSASRKRLLSSESAARSALVTGEPPTFVSTRAEVRAPGLKYSSATAPASRAAEAKRSRAASASVSASTLKGGMSATERKA